jgi:hypothetical protein
VLIRSPATGNFSAELKALTSALLVLSQISVSAFSCTSVGTLKHWTLPNIVDDDALRSVFLAKTDGSGICPTGFNVPTEVQLKAETDIWDRTTVELVATWLVPRFLSIHTSPADEVT